MHPGISLASESMCSTPLPLSRSLVSLESISKHTPFGAKCRRAACTMELVSGLGKARRGCRSPVECCGSHMCHLRWLCSPHRAVLSPPACPQERRAGVATRDVPWPGVLSTTLILFSVETKVFSGSSERQREARMTVSAPAVEWKLLGGSLAAGLSSPSSDLPEPAEPPRQSFPAPGIPLPGFLCPLQDACACPQEDGGVRTEGASPRGKERGRQGWNDPSVTLMQKTAPCLPGPDSHTLTSRSHLFATAPAGDAGPAGFRGGFYLSSMEKAAKAAPRGARSPSPAVCKASVTRG